MTIKRFFVLIFLIISLAMPRANAANSDFDYPKWTLGVNVTETAAFLIGKQIVGWKVTFIPIHIDGSYQFSNHWGLAYGAVYRYENYGRNITAPFGEGDFFQLWTNYHELFLMAGPRYAFFGEGNSGLYAALKAGFGGALSSGGYAISAVFQPEMGYSFLFGESKAFHLDLAAGMLLNLPLHERPRFGFNTTAIGWLVHRTIPIVRVGIGIAF